MGSDSKKAYNAEGRTDLLHMNPFNLTIVGLDDEALSEEERENFAGMRVLADPDRVALGYDEAMVESIASIGIIEPILVRKNGLRPNGTPNIEVVVGRGRVMSCREVWVRLRKAGVTHEADLPKVPAIPARGEEADLLAYALSENMIRRQETPLSAARKAKRFYLLTKDKARTAKVCGVTVKTVDAWLSVLSLSPKVHALIEAGSVSASAALTLTKDVPAEKQEERVKEALASGMTKGLGARVEAKQRRAPEHAPSEAAAKPTEAPDPIPLPSRRNLRLLRNMLDEGYAARNEAFDIDQVVGLLDFILDGKAPKGRFRVLWKQATKKARGKGS